MATMMLTRRRADARHAYLLDRQTEHDRLTLQGQVWEPACEQMLAQVYKYAGREFNVGSPLQLAQVLYEDLKLLLGNVERNTLRDLGNAGIARRAVKAVEQGTLRELPGERVLPPAAPDQKHFHLA